MGIVETLLGQTLDKYPENLTRELIQIQIHEKNTEVLRSRAGLNISVGVFEQNGVDG